MANTCWTFFAAEDFTAIDICATGKTQSKALKCVEALGGTCYQIRTEAYDRFVKNNTFVIHLKKRNLTKAHASLLKRARCVTIEPRYNQIGPIVLSPTDTEDGWTVEESQECFDSKEWMVTEMRQTLRCTLKAVQTILNHGAKDGLTIDCVKKIRKA